MSELKIDKEKVLEAMKECPDFARIAKKLWGDEVVDNPWQDITLDYHVVELHGPQILHGYEFSHQWNRVKAMRIWTDEKGYIHITYHE